MKILYHHRIASKDGQYVHIEEIVSALRGLGHEVVMVEPASINRKAFGQSSNLVKKMRTHLPDFLHELAEFFYSVKDYFKLTAAIRKHRPDFIYERYNLYFPSGIWAKRRFKLPLLLEVNSPLFEERSKHDAISLTRLAEWSERYVWQNADYVLPVTGVLAGRIIARGVPQQQIVVIPNGINKQRFNQTGIGEGVRKRLNLDGKLVLGFTGFIREWHRLDRVLEVIAANRDESWHLLVVGDGPEKKALQEQAQRLGIASRVTFTGIVGRDDIPSYVDCFDIALQPDVVDYASPLKLFEYLVLGKAVIAPNRENIREVLTHGENALLFEPENDADFCEKLTSVCSSDQLRRELGSAAARLVEERQYYWQTNAEKIVALFEKTLDRSMQSTVSGMMEETK